MKRVLIMLVVLSMLVCVCNVSVFADTGVLPEYGTCELSVKCISGNVIIRVDGSEVIAEHGKAYTYRKGTIVELEALEGFERKFLNWSGRFKHTDPKFTFALTEDTQLEANFAMGERILGDINLDWKVDALDFAMLRMYLLGQEISSKSYIAAADLNQDGEIDALDFILLRKRLLGIK